MISIPGRIGVVIVGGREVIVHIDGVGFPFLWSAVEIIVVHECDGLWDGEECCFGRGGYGACFCFGLCLCLCLCREY